MGLFTGGIGKMFGAVGDVLRAPFKILSGDLSGFTDVVKAPFKLTAGAIQTVVGGALLPITIPLGLMGSMFGGGFGSPQARIGAQSAVGNYMGQSPGYW